MKLDLQNNPEQPLYLRLSEQLRQQVRAGVLRPGDRLPSFTQMRQDYGVHKSTVERAHMILEQEGLIVRQSGAGTFVAQTAKRPVRHVIGISGYGFGFTSCSSYWAKLLNGVRQAAEQKGQQVLLLDNHSSDCWEKADGALVCNWGTLNEMHRVPANFPCVSLMVPATDVSSVCADDYNGTRALTKHLISLGHQRIAYLHGSDPNLAPKRLGGYQDALLEAGIIASPNWQRALPGGIDFGQNFVKTGQAAMRFWMQHNWNDLGCTAILAHNDETALGVIEALREAGVLVPQNVSVAGFDGLDIGVYASPSLTTSQVPLEEIGAQAVSLLLQQIESGDGVLSHQVLQPQLLARQSTSAPLLS